MIKTLEIYKMEMRLNRLGKSGIPTAIRNTLNKSSIRTYKEAGKNIKSKFENRNQWTYRSNRYQKAKGSNVKKMKAETGSVQAYMRQQEHGYTQHGRKHGVQVPTGETAGQGGQQKRTKVIKRRFYTNKITLLNQKIKRKNIKNERQKRVVVARMAVKTKQRFYFGTFGGTTGLWHLKGGRISAKNRGWPKGLKLKLLYSATKKTVKTKKTKWLEPAAKDAIRLQGKDYSNELKKVLDKM